ncbi:hypothetical protein [Legionella quateirensis]|uniref:hypothetical protein n=1 Tax=Legionella quateirensis TaxID=45072 RepID=UPI000A48A801|nr:hypothetical protein [Legionella quateirensis]
MKDLLNVALCQNLEILRCAQDDVIISKHDITLEIVIPNAMRDLLNVALRHNLEILRCAQDDVII